MIPADLSANERLVLAALHDRAGASRAEVVRHTGLAKATVNGIVARLLRRGLVSERPAGGAATDRGQGRPPTVLLPAVQAGNVGVVAFSHVMVRAGIVTGDGWVLARRDEDLHGGDGERDLLDRAARLFTAVAAEAVGDVACVVVGVPAPFQRGAGVAEETLSAEVRAGIPGEAGVFHRFHGDPAPDLAARLGVPVIAENDANLGTLGEATFGAGRGVDSFMYVKVVEGLGAGLYLGGRLYRGARGHAGELAHVQVTDDGQWCRCGGRGCLAHAFGGFLAPFVESAYGRPLRFADVATFSRHGEAGTRRIVADAGRMVGRVLADVCTVLSPEAVIVDGALGAAATPFIAGLREMIDRHSPAVVAAVTRVVAGTLEDRAELLGAVALARQEHLARPERPGR